LIVDFLGRSEFGSLSVRVPPEGRVTGLIPDKDPDTCRAEEPCFFDESRNVSFPLFPIRIERNDIANFTFGLRYVLGISGSVFFGGVVPLNDDGFRPDFIPSAGIEYTF
jgi:hypothetical protein